MGQENYLMDWYLRYNKLLGKRYTKKQKDLFLESLAADISLMRSDCEISSFHLHEKGAEYRNLYVGDMKKAKTIFCTYYDTPAVHFDPYVFFDVEKRKRSTTKSILLSSVFCIAVGLLFTLFVAVPIFEAYALLSLWPMLCILVYMLYFLYMGRITRGFPEQKTLVQNTSSVLALLEMIRNVKQENAAFAFVDAGCTNNAGLTKLMERKKSKGVFYLLDSVGSKRPLYQISQNTSLFVQADGVEHVRSSQIEDDRLIYLISADRAEEKYHLKKEDLRQAELNGENMEYVTEYMKQVLRGRSK